jgi:hypothetical protein
VAAAMIITMGLLALAGAATLLAQSAWRSVVRYKAPYRFAEGRQLPRPAPTGRVFFIVIDGLRVDASKRMPFLNELRAKGADLVAAVGTPSYSRPGRATLATGTWPEIHGVSTNDFEGPLDADNIIRSLARTGRRCRIAGSLIWPELFAADIARCGAARGLIENEHPGLFRSYRSTLEAEEETSLAFALAEPGDLTIVDFVATDAAAHDLGAASNEYQEETQRIDGIVRRIVGHVGTEGTTFVITADHGHRDRGGHGSDEPEVLSVPLILVGPLVRIGVHGSVRQTDVAPTLAALLGAAIPGTASGRVLTEALTLDGDLLRLAQNASTGQQRQFAEAYARTAGVNARGLPDDPDSAINAVRQQAVSHETRRRLPATLGLAALAVAIGAFGLRGGAAQRKATLLGLAVYFVVFGGLLFVMRQALTLSAVNFDEQVTAFFRPFVVDSFIAFLVAGAILLWGNRTEPGPRFGRVLQGVALLVALGIAFLAWAYGFAGLFSAWRLASIPTLFAMFVAALQLVGVSVATLVLAAVPSGRR